MYIVKSLIERWHQSKQQFFSFFYLCIVQTWWNFNFPAFQRLGTPYNTLFAISLTIMSVVVYFSLLFFPEKYVSLFDLETFDDAPNATILKKILRIWLIVLIHVSFFYTWYIDFYDMSHEYYMLLYCHWAIAFIVIYHVMASPIKDDVDAQ